MSDVAHGDPTDDDSIATLLSRIVADAEHVARSEVELQKAKIVAKIDEARSAVFLLLAAVATASVALTALVVGALMVLAPMVGPLWSTIIVVGALTGAAALLGWLSLQQFKRLFGASEHVP